MQLSNTVKQILKADTSIVVPTKKHLQERLKFLTSKSHNQHEINYNNIKIKGRDAYIVSLLKEFTDELIHKNKISKIIELLPGKGDEFSLAFSKSGYRGRYDKLDLFHFLGEEETLKVKEKYSQMLFSESSQVMTADIFLWAKDFKNKDYDAVLAKHPFDDLIIGLYAAEKGISSYEYFSDPKMCKKHWDLAIKDIDKYLIEIRNLAKNISKMIKVGGYFIGINHPDTFAVKGKMIEKIVVSQYARNLFVYELLECGFEYISSDTVENYNENTYPNSLFVLKKVCNTKKEVNRETYQMIKAYLNRYKPDLVYPSVFSVLNYHKQPVKWYLNIGGERIHSEMACLLNFLEERASLTDNKAIILENIQNIKNYFENDTPLIKKVSDILTDCLQMLDLKSEALEIFTTLEPCIKRENHSNCKTILKETGIHYCYGATDSIKQSKNDYFFTCDTFINYNKLHFLALYFLNKYPSIFVAGGDLFTEEDEIVFKGGFTSEGDMMGIKKGVLFINTKKTTIEKVHQKMQNEEYEPLQVIINTDNYKDFDKEITKKLFKTDSVYLVHYY